MRAPLARDKDAGEAVKWPGTVGTGKFWLCVDPKSLIRVESIGLEELRTRKQLGNATCRMLRRTEQDTLHQKTYFAHLSI
jgi:hypothetical protein